jgi:Zn ribbon nucleic-acid-binding protein
MMDPTRIPAYDSEVQRVDSEQDLDERRSGVQVVDRAMLWRESGLRPGQIVECVVIGHRGWYGIDVEISDLPRRQAAFIDFMLLAERNEPVTPESFPRIGSRLTAVVVDFTPSGELRLSARASAIDECRRRGEGTPV